MTEFLEGIDASMKVVRTITTFEPIVDSVKTAEHPVSDAVITVIEATTILSIADEERFNEAFNRCLARIQQVSVASGLAARQSIDVANRQNLPMVVPMCLQNVGTETWHDLSMFEIPNHMIARWVPAEFDETMLARMAHFLSASERSEPIFGYLELRAESQRFLMREGDTRTSVILIAAACEVLLDFFLLSMLWEEGISPDDAAQVFLANSGVSKRVKSCYALRVRGHWSFDQSGPIKSWYEGVANLRNQCVHRGYRPSMVQASTAHEIAETLRQFIVERLKQPYVAKLYPKTANFFLSRSALRDQLDQDFPKLMSWREKVSVLRCAPGA
jgi:hypothetical protein